MHVIKKIIENNRSKIYLGLIIIVYGIIFISLTTKSPLIYLEEGNISNLIINGIFSLLLLLGVIYISYYFLTDIPGILIFIGYLITRKEGLLAIARYILLMVSMYIIGFLFYLIVTSDLFKLLFKIWFLGLPLFFYFMISLFILLFSSPVWVSKVKTIITIVLVLFLRFKDYIINKLALFNLKYVKRRSLFCLHCETPLKLDNLHCSNCGRIFTPRDFK